jgi:hypothetical protein
MLNDNGKGGIIENHARAVLAPRAASAPDFASDTLYPTGENALN